MASNPSFNVMEDQTDEDFFDKLVDDDFEGTMGSDLVGTKLMEAGSDSDEAKAFANLSIDDVKFESDLAGVSVSNGVSEKTNGVALDAMDTAGVLSVVDTNESVGIGSDVVPALAESNVNTGGESGKSGIKEVGWSSFYADSMPSGDGFVSYSDFFSELGDSAKEFSGKAIEESGNLDGRVGGAMEDLTSYEQHQHGNQVFGGDVADSGRGQDLNSSQYWESMYPGWRYDESTGKWFEVGASDAAASMQHGTIDESSGSELAVGASDGKIKVNYLQQTSHSVVGTVAETSTTKSVSTWNGVSNGNGNGYPEHMVFDPQYPGWYYDTIAQEWRSLESYMASGQSKNLPMHDQQQNGFAFNGSYSQNTNATHGEYAQPDEYGSQSLSSRGKHGNWGDSFGSYNQQGLNVWQPETATPTDSDFGRNPELGNSFSSNVSVNNDVDQISSFNFSGTVPSYEYEKASQGHAEANGFVGSQILASGRNFSQQFNVGNMKHNEQVDYSNDFYSSQKPVGVSQQMVQTSQPFSYAPNMNRSSAGRPPHALVTFGFGGKLVVVRNENSLGIGNQDSVGGSISVLNLMEVVLGGIDNASCVEGSVSSYFHTLCSQSFPGPLMGGSVGSKELNKWIDERIANCESANMSNRKGDVLKLLLSLLKIAYQHYGKLRSPFGSNGSLMESDAPEMEVAKIFASAKRSGMQFGEYGAFKHCLQNVPSEGQLRATASEVQNLLISGNKKEALQCAQEGQLWGPALVLASQFGDQFYIDSVKLMALRQLVAGSPLRTLCLLIAGQPADVFSTEVSGTGAPGALITSQQPAQSGTNGMLDDWEENLAVITANRTKGDEFVLMHLGDCLWKDKNEVTAAHICYLIAEANFDPYSDTARLCLIGGDHWKHPRSYASPEAIQRTELYEYAKLLGNSQFTLQPFLPYKLIYAYMLAEVGKISDSLKYCQAVLKSLKTGRVSDAETWRHLVQSLEERIRAHQQGGYSNLAPKLVGKLLNVFDSTARRVVGGLPPPMPSTSVGSIQINEYHHPQTGPRVSTSQSTMAMSSLVNSNSMEPISDWAADANRMTVHNRSVSEPNFGRSPRQDHVDPSKDGTSSSTEGKSSASPGASRFGRFSFGSQLLQKTVGLVMRPRTDKQAKLGEKNKFYYDEKLKRWVEEGAETPAEEPVLAPPPTTLSFQNETMDYNLKSALNSDPSPNNGSSTIPSPTPAEHTSRIPPIPSSSNQFSARGRMGVRARYVDTFNQGGGSSGNLFQSPSFPSAKPATAANAKFFVPSASSGSDATDVIYENVQDPDPASSEKLRTSTVNDSSHSHAFSSPMTMQRFPSVDNIPRKGGMMDQNGAVSSNSRRIASWSGSFGDPHGVSEMLEGKGPKPLGEVQSMPRPSFMHSERSPNMPINGGSFGDELHEVEL